MEELLGSGGAEAAWALASALVRRAAPEALQRIADAAAGLDLALLCEETMEVLRRALLVAVTGTPGPDATQDETARLGALGPEAGAGEPDLLLLLRGLLDADTEMRRSPHPRVDLEIAVVRLCHRPRAELIETVLARLEQAEARLRGFGGPTAPAGPVQSDLLGAPPESALPRPVAVPRAVERSPAPPPRGGAPRDPAPPVRDTPVLARAPSPSVPRSAAETWSAIVAEVIRVRPTLGHLLSEGVVVGEETGGSPTRCRKAARSRMISSRSRRTGSSCSRRPGGSSPGSVTSRSPPEARRGVPAGTHPVVQAAMELFEGEITQVRAAPGPRASATPEPAAGGGEAP